MSLSNTPPPSGSPSSSYKAHIDTIFTANKLTDAQASLKQIAKLLQGITPKSRQIPLSNFVVKKFVQGITGGMDLLHSLGFTEITVNNKTYLTLPEQVDYSNIGTIAAEILAASTSPPTQLTSTSTPIPRMDDHQSLANSEMNKDVVIAGTPVDPKKCSSGCGFYANDAFDGMCSSCFKSQQSKQTQAHLKNRLARVAKQTFKNQCATLHCPFSVWKDAPKDYAVDLSNALKCTHHGAVCDKNNTMSDKDIPKEPQIVESTPTDAIPTQTPAIQTQTLLKCMYCSIGDVVKTFRAENPPTVSERRRIIGLKVRAMGVISTAMRVIQKDKTRCWTCQRRFAGLSGTECRCGFVFCGLHRYAQSHDCTFDHLSRYASTLAKSTLNDINKTKLEKQEDEY